MNDFLRLAAKELRELARPRYLVPLLLAPLFMVVVMQGVGSVQDPADQQMAVAVVNNDTGELGRLAVATLDDRANLTYNATAVSPERAIENVQAGPARALVVIPAGFTERIQSEERAELAVYSAISGVNAESTSQSARVTALLDTVDRRLALATTDASAESLAPTSTTHTTYVRDTRVATSPSALSSAISVEFLLLAMAMVFAIFGAGQLMINGMGSEKENKTLETLLTMPVERRTIVAAKLASSAVLGLALAGLYTAAIYLSRPSNAGTAAAVPQLSAADYGLVGVLLALAIIDVLALALCLGVFADDSKGAQTLMVPLVLVTMAPAFVTQFFDVSSLSLPLKAALFSVPSTYPVLAPQRLLFGDTTVALVGIAYEVTFAAVMIWLAVRLFESDRLVTGDAGRLGAVIETLQR